MEGTAAPVLYTEPLGDCQEVAADDIDDIKAKPSHLLGAHVSSDDAPEMSMA